jgi:hypothetical protein
VEHWASCGTDPANVPRETPATDTEPQSCSMWSYEEDEWTRVPGDFDSMFHVEQNPVAQTHLFHVEPHDRLPSELRD